MSTHSKNIEAYIQHFPEISASSWVHHSANVIGRVKIADHSSIWCGAVIRGDVNHINIGHHTNIQDLSVLHVSHPTTIKSDGSPLNIGNYVTVGHNVILHGCNIQDECLIGMGSLIMDDAIVERNVIVGAGSLVSEGKILESGFLYLGRPAKKIRALTPEEIAYFKKSADYYTALSLNYINPRT
ncbi:gamma carbonic anhydrase family protein [Sulfuriferula nivalis]|uniref:Gamma carbonic anhydrase family protein n=1 Tax=Sulfuriferula nivalis TaxID=2675298 RepID=A0A809SBU8_9PROT|nr:gamma carbonic anhydrase family protein [Sulfuriferula nivalis]